ncbi:MAG: hypothetical protein KGZ38_03770 [Erysipelothrix sp.]|nr:hypothetical protein [Erysipelothrix sp.]
MKNIRNVLNGTSKILIFIMAVILFLVITSAAYLTFMYNPLIKMEITYAWPEYKGKLVIRDKKELTDFLKVYREIESIPGQLREEDFYYLVKLEYKRNLEQVVLDKKLKLYNPATKNYEYSPHVQSFFARHITELDNSYFGEIITWQEIAPKIPKGKAIELRDIETGFAFSIRRYGGVSHADIEPLDVEDTQILKNIYGNWSWKRRAVVATIEGKQYAASINGMPHGGGKIWDNDFRGHFCLHFLSSKTHGGGRIDPAHQLMIHKAGGKLPELLDLAEPENLTEYVLAAIVSEDLLPIRYIVEGHVEETIWNGLKGIRYIAVNRVYQKEGSDHAAAVEVDATFYKENTADFSRRVVFMEYTMDEVRNSWRLKRETLVNLYNEVLKE